jgi:hypothetical protein
MQQRESFVTTITFASAPHRLIWLLGVLVILLAAIYMYAVSASVLHVVLREEVLKETASMHSQMGELEGKYFTMQSSITRSLAVESGYIPLTDKQFVSTNAQNGITLNQ